MADNEEESGTFSGDIQFSILLTNPNFSVLCARLTSRVLPLIITMKRPVMSMTPIRRGVTRPLRLQRPPSAPLCCPLRHDGVDDPPRLQYPHRTYRYFLAINSSDWHPRPAMRPSHGCRGMFVFYQPLLQCGVLIRTYTLRST